MGTIAAKKMVFTADSLAEYLNVLAAAQSNTAEVKVLSARQDLLKIEFDFTSTMGS